MKRIFDIFLAIALLIMVASCASQHKMKALQSGAYRPALTLAQEEDYIPDISKEMKTQRASSAAYNSLITFPEIP